MLICNYKPFIQHKKIYLYTQAYNNKTEFESIEREKCTSRFNEIFSSWREDNEIDSLIPLNFYFYLVFVIG